MDQILLASTLLFITIWNLFVGPKAFTKRQQLQIGYRIKNGGWFEIRLVAVKYITTRTFISSLI